MILLVFAIFTIFGPPIAYCLFLAGYLSMNGIPQEGMLTLIVLGTVTAYAAAGAQSVVLGVAASISYWVSKERRIGLTAVIWTSVCLSAIPIVMNAFGRQAGSFPMIALTSTALLAVHVGTAFACWALAKGMVSLTSVRSRPSSPWRHVSSMDRERP